MPRGKLFRGTVQTVAPMHPFIGPSSPIERAVPIGIEVRTNREFPFDPWFLMGNDVINSTVFTVVGQKRSGKSTLMKSLILRLGGLQPGQDPEMKIFIHDRRSEKGEGEYSKVARFLGSKPFRLNQSGLLNIFDPQMFREGDKRRTVDLIDLADSVCEMVSGHPLTGIQPLVLQAGIHKMVKQYSGVTSPEILEIVLRGLTMDDIDVWYKDRDVEVMKTFQEELEEAGLKDKLRLDMSRPHNLDESQVRQDAALISSYFTRLREGYGGIFSGKGSMRKIFASPVVLWDWTGVPEKAIELLQFFMMRIRLTALASQQWELIPHLEFGDEIWKITDQLLALQNRLELVKTARSFHTASFDATQEIQDLTQSGDAMSGRRSTAEAIARGTAAWMIGRQPADRKTAAILRELGITSTDIDFITQMPRGCFAFVVPGEPPVFFHNTLGPTEVSLMGTNFALDRMLERETVIPPNQSEVTNAR